MKLLFIPTGNAPEFYQFDGETVYAHFGGVIESFDLSGLQTGDKFLGIAESNPLPQGLDVRQIIRDAYRDDSGELHLTLCQAVGPGHWVEGVEFDAAQYRPDAVNVGLTPRAHEGTAWVQTSEGRMSVPATLYIEG